MFSHEKTLKETFILLKPGLKLRNTKNTIFEVGSKKDPDHLGFLPVEKGNEKARWNISMK